MRSVAAEALGGVASHAKGMLEAERLAKVLGALWDVLLTLDDLTASATHVMGALAAYSAHLPYAALSAFVATSGASGLADVVPRVWPFLRHPAAAARAAALTTLSRLLTAAVAAGDAPPAWLGGTDQLGAALRVLVQTAALDAEAKVHTAAVDALRSLLRAAPAEQLCSAAVGHLSTWIAMIGTPLGAPIEREGFLRLPFAHAASGGSGDIGSLAAVAAGGEEWTEAAAFEESHATVGVHERGAAALGAIMCMALGGRAGGGPTTGCGGEYERWCHVLLEALQSRLLTPRLVAAWTVAECATQQHAAATDVDVSATVGGEPMAAALMQLATSRDAVAGASEELEVKIVAMRNEANALFHIFERCGASVALLLTSSWESSEWPGAEPGKPPPPVGVVAAQQLCTTIYTHWLTLLPPSATHVSRSRCEDVRKRLLQAREVVMELLDALTISIGEAAAEAVVGLRALPAKLNPVIQSLMNALQGGSASIQTRAARAIASLLTRLVACSKEAVADMVGNNLCYLLTPMPPKVALSSVEAAVAERSARHAACGAQQALLECCSAFGGELFERMPSLWVALHRPLTAAAPAPRSAGLRWEMIGASRPASGEELQHPALANSLSTKSDLTRKAFEALGVAGLRRDHYINVNGLYYRPAEAHAMRSSLKLVCGVARALASPATMALLSLLPEILSAVTSDELPGATDVDLTHSQASANDVAEAPREPQMDAAPASNTSSDSDVRQLAADAVATCCDTLGCAAIEQVLGALLPVLQPTAPPAAQIGGALCLRAIVTLLDVRVLPYAALLVAPLVACLSSHAPRIRAEGAAAFGRLMPILPLEPGTPNPPEMSAAMAERKASERPFVDQLLGLSGAKPPRYEMPVAVQASLRPYQQAGVDWLAFLRRFGLHGILCDDMGLGKTLQTLCVLSAAAHERRELEATRAREGQTSLSPLPSLVVCPPTLTGHWIAEAAKFCPGTLHCVEYVGSSAARAKLLPSLAKYELVVASYDTLRADVESLCTLRWDYVVLDEGHVIRNAKTKLSVAAKRLPSSRRLILSGTPLQNNAVELWSLFDFLMPNYLGSHAHFQATYARPIHASMGARAGDAAHLEGEAVRANHPSPPDLRDPAIPPRVRTPMPIRARELPTVAPLVCLRHQSLTPALARECVRARCRCWPAYIVQCYHSACDALRSRSSLSCRPSSSKTGYATCTRFKSPCMPPSLVLVGRLLLRSPSPASMLRYRPARGAVGRRRALQHRSTCLRRCSTCERCATTLCLR